VSEAVAHIQEQAPGREAGDALYRQMVERAAKADANIGFIRSRR
jgi:hypothetical protein